MQECKGERPIRAAKGKQTNTMALCQPPPPPTTVAHCTLTVHHHFPRGCRAVTTERTAFEDYQRYMNSGSSPKTIDPEMAKQHLFYSVNFIPLRPFSVTVGLVIRKATGGMWRYDVDLEALPPDPDDIIQIEAPLGRTESVSFHLTNIFPSNDPFTAYFTPETPSEFTVMPTKGVIMGMQRSP